MKESYAVSTIVGYRLVSEHIQRKLANHETVVRLANLGIHIDQRLYDLETLYFGDITDTDIEIIVEHRDRGYGLDVFSVPLDELFEK